MILQAQFPFLNNNEKRILHCAWKMVRIFKVLPSRKELQIESVRSRVWQIRKKIKKSTANYMEEFL